MAKLLSHSTDSSFSFFLRYRTFAGIDSFVTRKLNFLTRQPISTKTRKPDDSWRAFAVKNYLNWLGEPKQTAASSVQNHTYPMFRVSN